MAKKKIQFDLKEVSNLAARGLTQAQIADVLGVCTRTVSYRLIDDPEFASAYQKGRASGTAKVANALLDNALKGNVTAQIFFLKNIGGWADVGKQEIEVNQPFQLIIKNDLPPDSK